MISSLLLITSRKIKESIKEMNLHFIFVRIMTVAHIRSCNGSGNLEPGNSRRYLLKWRFKLYHILHLFLSSRLYLILLSIFFPFSSLSSVLITNASIALLIAIFVCPYGGGKIEKRCRGEREIRIGCEQDKKLMDDVTHTEGVMRWEWTDQFKRKMMKNYRLGWKKIRGDDNGDNSDNNNDFSSREKRKP